MEPTEASVTEPTEAPVTGAPTPRNGEQFVVGYTPENDPIVEHRRIFDLQFKEAIEGAGAVHLYCSGKGDAVTQNNCMDQFIAQNVDIIIFKAIDNTAIAGSIIRANEAGIPTFGFISEVPAATGAKVTFTLNVDDWGAGRNAGNALVRLLTEKYGSPKGSVLEVQGGMTTSAAQLRGGGFHEVVDEYPDINVVSKDAEWDPAKGTTIIQDWFTANPDTDAIYDHSDCTYLPSEKAALEPLGKWAKVGDPNHVIIVTEDGCPLTLNQVKCGYVDVDSDFAIADIAAITADIVVEYMETGNLPQVGDSIERPDTFWQRADVVEKPETSGPVMLVASPEVTKDNADDPRLFGNMQPPPNGMSECEE
jgi:ABC-type sugar transport system substrate-binding protein